MGERKRRGATTRGFVCLAWAMALVACSPRKAEHCARLRTVLLAQARMHDEFSEHLRDARACETQALYLKARVAELRALQVSDAALAEALRHYLTGMEGLAEAYGRAARAHQNGTGAAELQSLAASLLAHADAVDRAGLSLLHACRGP